LARPRGRSLAVAEPIRVEDACTGVCYVGGAFPISRPRVSGIMRNGALWECLLSVSGRSYKDLARGIVPNDWGVLFLTVSVVLVDYCIKL